MRAVKWGLVALGVALGFMGPSAAIAEGEQAGDFDYYVMALSWTPSWCAIEGDARGSEQCDPDTGFGWTLHGLWPQFESGWPSYCRTNFRNPSRSDTAAQVGLFGSGGLAWHQWNKHGRCSGLSSDGYYDLSREAYDTVVRPAIFRQLDKTYRLPARVVEDAFVKANPGLEPDMISITCRDGFVQEAQICLTTDLEFRTCGRDVRRDCTRSDARMDPLR